jgi:hypothetical protein
MTARDPMEPRRVAVLLWAALVVMLALFLGIVLVLPSPQLTIAPDALFWGAVATSAVGVALSRVLPPHVGPRYAVGRDALGFIRLVLGWALCHGVAIFPLVGYLVTRDGRLLAVFAIDALALCAYFPSRSRWAMLSALRERAGRSAGMVR